MSQTRVCGVARCGKQLRTDNGTGWCRAHRSATSRAPVRICADGDCGEPLRATNKSGYCWRHVQQTPNVLRRNEMLRAGTQAGREARPPCPVKGCPKRLRSDNKSGRCRDHTYVLVTGGAECAFDDCANRLSTRNTTGRCMEHQARSWVAAVCAADDCEKTLNVDNTTGYCRKHRGLAVDYFRDYRESRKAEFQEYSANRRIGVRVGMTKEDRRRSTAHRKEIRNDPCFYCGATETHHVDHYFPVRKGGTDHFQNLVRTCRTCNQRKYNRCGTKFRLLSGTW